MNAVVPTQLDAPELAADSERRAALLASLVRGLTEAVLASVQRTTELNWAAARVLLARSQPANLHECAESSTMAWHWSWRSFRICATTAAQVLDLCHDHAQSTTDDLWRALRQAGAGLPGIDGQRSLELQAALRSVEAAFTAYIGAVGSLQRGLVALAQGESE